ncbi:MAG: formate--tetrahydrofolate ligase, partial [Pseudomonadota bacterium]|nr:formate--tetrahydrofolate ligase [Pseudomonadota bacterium]
SDYVVTEAGFGADLGAEKFIDIKCRMGNLKPKVVVLVATVRALKYHGGVEIPDLAKENLSALERGCDNLERHLENIKNNYGLNCVVAINHFSADSAEEINFLEEKVRSLDAEVSVARHWAEGGRGAEDLAEKVLDVMDSFCGQHSYLYADEMPLLEKIENVAKKVYRAKAVSADKKVMEKIARLQKDYGHMPVCIAKTQMSFSTDPSLRGAPTDHVLDIRDVKVAAGAGFVVVIAGNIMTMPGLPKIPSAEKIDVSAKGRISGLF